ncbi:hypothetical protein PUN4_310054 [Paraburkholderia unamae]|nr:hypothetical protein PUN4_310054 [Paraburkholderia unamae]
MAEVVCVASRVLNGIGQRAINWLPVSRDRGAHFALRILLEALNRVRQRAWGGRVKAVGFQRFTL